MWVCKKCETENNDSVDYCFICRAWRFEFVINNAPFDDGVNIYDSIKLETLDGKDDENINSSSVLEENNNSFQIAVEEDNKKDVKSHKKLSNDIFKFVIIAVNILLFALVVYFIFVS